MRQIFNCRALTNMQINVIEYFAKGALLKCRDKMAIIEQSARHTFTEIERFANNCAALILKRNAAVPDVTAANPMAKTTDAVGVSTQRFYRVLIVQ
jgi:hypothetical protein